MHFLHCGKYKLSLARPLIMGVVNVTPDSFSDGGHFLLTAAAVARARQLIAEGADILDVGGESTRPGAAPVTLEEERRRVLPVLAALTDAGVPLSVDTQKPELMREAAAAGAAIINDVNGFEAPGAFAAVVDSGDSAICIMHRQGSPESMQQAPQYGDVVREVSAYLGARVAAAEQAGIARERIVIDPGFGFGKTLEHNLALLRGIGSLAPGVPVLAGLSRKSMIGALTGREIGERVFGSVAAALIAAQHGAAIVRVHDVAATRDALAVWESVQMKSDE